MNDNASLAQQIHNEVMQQLERDGYTMTQHGSPVAAIKRDVVSKLEEQGIVKLNINTPKSRGRHVYSLVDVHYFEIPNEADNAPKTLSLLQKITRFFKKH